jgi:hypothetical protein
VKRVLVVMAFWLVSGAALGADEQEEKDPGVLFKSATEALAAERPTDAIAMFEALGDRGVTDPVVSFGRGLAYAARVRAGAERPGDLGRAAHGFEEARELSRDSALVDDAGRALVAVRGEIARRRARAGDPVELAHGISLGRSIVRLLPENVWAVLAALASAALTVGLVFATRSHDRRRRVGGATTCAVAGGVLVASAFILEAARDARFHLREGVVVMPSRLLDARHIAKGDVAPIPEGARARLLGDEDDLVKVAIGRAEGFLPRSAVLPLAKR